MFEETICNQTLVFETCGELFSPNAIDKGTRAMLENIEFTHTDKVLDLGCGYGVAGILAAKLIGGENVVLCDISEKAVALAKQNAKRNGVENVNICVSDGCDAVAGNDFTFILSNPPYHTDFSVAKRFIEGGFQKLRTGGMMVMVTKRLGWYQNKLAATFGGVRVSEHGGYYVFFAEKRQEKPAKRKPPQKGNLSRKLRRKYKK